MSTPASRPIRDRLELLYRLSQAFNSTLDLDEVLNRLLDEVVTNLTAERGFVMLGDEQGRLAVRVARGLEHQTLKVPDFLFSQGVIDKVISDGQPVLTHNASLDDRFNLRQSVVFHQLRSILCVPLRIKERIAGVIYIDNRAQAGIFTEGDMELLNAIAATAAIAIENARLYQVAVEKGRLERELQMAHEVQASLLPQRMPEIPGWEFAAHWQPARDVAGDYYDLFPLSRNYYGLVVADVSDKGMPAALFMASTRSIIRASMDQAASPVEGLNHANQLICAESEDRPFVTLFFMQIQPVTGLAQYVSAGHNPPLHYSAATNSMTPLIRTGMPLGIEPDIDYEQREITLQRGDFIFLYTDGVTDATNELLLMYGEDRMNEVIHAYRNSNAASIVAGLVRSLQAFTGGANPFDDITILVVKRL